MAYTTIDNPDLYFQIKLWTGNDATSRALTFDGSVDMQPNLLWTKIRTQAYSNTFFDSVRGVTKFLSPNESDAESTSPSQGFLTSFDSDGFTVEDGSSAIANFNKDSDTYVSWAWKESSTAGFDIVSYTGNSSDGTTTQDISHSLSAVPHWIIIKNRADDTNWAVYHKKNTSAPDTEIIYLNATNATADDNAFFGDTAPTSSQFRVGGDNGVNGNSDAMIAYLWSEKKGYSKFGSFIGNNNGDGAFVYCGFKPQFLLVKNSTTAHANHDWILFDNKREAQQANEIDTFTKANEAAAETTSGRNEVDFLSNGFKARASYGDFNGGSGDTFIFMAFAESPFVNSNKVPNNAE